jgi:hypothetical protein
VLRSCPVTSLVSRPTERFVSRPIAAVCGPMVQGPDALAQPEQYSWAQCFGRLRAQDAHSGREGEPGKS